MNNEITLKLKCSITEMQKILVNKGFILTDKFDVEDIYYIPKGIDIEALTLREILKQYILIRDIKQYESEDFVKYHKIIKITFKKKDIATNGDIIEQEKYDCEIKEKEQGKNILKAINYKEIMTIKENDIVYSKDGLNMEIKNIINGEKLIEIECNNKYKTIDELKQMIIKLNIPIDKSDFFVKKAEIELKKVLGDLK